MRRIASAIAVALLASFLGSAAPAPGIQFNEQQRADLGRISAYLNAIHTLKGSFVQIDPNGDLEQGDFYIEKPGRMRFEYHPPATTLVVSDGDTVAVKNSKLNTVDRYPLTDTPLDIILGDNLDLAHNSAVTGVAEEQGALVVHARSNNNKAQGDITITFAAPQLELRQWTIVDSQGLSTTVALRDLVADQPLEGSLFVLRDVKSAFTKKGEE